MTILIATGIYPPQIGGPAKYAQKLHEELGRRGQVGLCAWTGLERALPWGIRHAVYFLRLLPKAMRADAILALDTWSTGFPALAAAKLLRRKLLVRVGGDFVWEAYIERTGDMVRLSEFYKAPRRLSFKERLIRRATLVLVRHADVLLFNSAWQMGIWQEAFAYKTPARVLENEYPAKKSAADSPLGKKIFVAAGRGIRYKNIPAFAEAFAKAAAGRAELDTRALPPHEHAARNASAYAYAVPSVSEVSSNNIIEALSYNKPFIAPLDCGMRERLDGLGVFVDTLDRRAMENAVEELLDDATYQAYVERIRQFSYVRTWGQIADEILDAAKI
jgi:glycosyltransferase involved in cell wall biosynthesis